MEQKQISFKNRKVWLMIIIVIFITFGLFYYKLIPFGFESPTNYIECVEAGGKTNKNQVRIQNNCMYNGKFYNGMNF